MLIYDIYIEFSDFNIVIFPPYMALYILNVLF